MVTETTGSGKTIRKEEILRAIKENKLYSKADLYRILKTWTIHRHVEKLEKEGLIKITPLGGNKIPEITNKGEKILKNDILPNKSE